MATLAATRAIRGIDRELAATALRGGVAARDARRELRRERKQLLREEDHVAGKDRRGAGGAERVGRNG